MTWVVAIVVGRSSKKGGSKSLVLMVAENGESSVRRINCTRLGFRDICVLRFQGIRLGMTIRV